MRVPVLENREHVSTLLVAEWSQSPVVENQHIDLREAREQPDVGPVGVGKVDSSKRRETRLYTERKPSRHAS